MITFDLIINGLLGVFGTVEIVGIVLFLMIGMVLLLMNYPIPAVLIMLLPLSYTLSTLGWIAQWVFAVILLFDGLILFLLIRNLERG